MPAARAFLELYFGLRPRGTAHANFDMLADDDGFVLTLMGVGRANAVSYPKTFHLGFIQASEADVDDIHRRLTGDGFDVEPPSRQHSAWAFSLTAPGSFGIAVRCGEKPPGPRSRANDERRSSLTNRPPLTRLGVQNDPRHNS